MRVIIYSLLALLALVVQRFVYNVYFHPLKNIPGPFWAKVSRLWLFILEMQGKPHEEITELHKKYGPIMRISPNEVTINDIDASNLIYGQTSKFDKSEYYYKAFEVPASNLFTMTNRQEHSQDKKLLSHSMSRANIVLHEKSIYKKAFALMGRITQLVKNDQAVPLFPAFRCITLDTICDFAFGKPANAIELENFDSTIMTAIDSANSFVPVFPFIRYLITLADALKINTVPNGFEPLKRAAEAGFEDMHHSESWTMFRSMASMAEKSTDLTKERLVSEGMLMIVAGTDTTACNMSVTVHNLIRQPKLYKMLQDEIKTVMPELDSMPSLQVLDALPLLEACIKEALRLSSPVHARLPRSVPSGGWTFNGHYLPAGVNVGSSQLFFHYNEKVFPNPKEYNPLRWLDKDENERKIMNSYFHPFSQGTRMCIGRNLSIIEQKIVLAVFVRHFNPKEVLDRNINFKDMVTAVPDNPLYVRLGLDD